MENKIQKVKRPEEIAELYRHAIDAHLSDLIARKVDTMFEIEDFARQLHLHPAYLSNLIKEHTGSSACGIYQNRIIAVAHQLMGNTSYTISDVAAILTFDPSQFTKWFKHLHGITPKQYRNGVPYTILK